MTNQELSDRLDAVVASLETVVSLFEQVIAKLERLEKNPILKRFM